MQSLFHIFHVKIEDFCKSRFIPVIKAILQLHYQYRMHNSHVAFPIHTVYNVDVSIA